MTGFWFGFPRVMHTSMCYMDSGISTSLHSHTDLERSLMIENRVSGCYRTGSGSSACVPVLLFAAYDEYVFGTYRRTLSVLLAN